MKSRIARLALWLTVAAVTCLSIGAALLTGAGRPWNKGDLVEGRVNDEFVFDAKSTNTIDIGTISTPVRVHESADNSIRLQLTGVFFGQEGYRPRLEAVLEGGALRAEIVHKPNVIFFGFHSTELVLDLYIPRKAFSRMDIHTTSGGVRTPFIRADQFHFRTVSGSLDVDDLNATQSIIRTTSGATVIHSLTGGLEFRSVSGGLTAGLKKLNGDLIMRTTSGSGHLTLPGDAGFQLDARSVSGRIHSDFPLLTTGLGRRDHDWSGTVGSGAVRIDWESVSGGLNISKK